jgi:hypothetical protein
MARARAPRAAPRRERRLRRHRVLPPQLIQPVHLVVDLKTQSVECGVVTTPPPTLICIGNRFDRWQSRMAAPPSSSQCDHLVVVALGAPLDAPDVRLALAGSRRPHLRRSRLRVGRGALVISDQRISDPGRSLTPGRMPKHGARPRPVVHRLVVLLAGVRQPGPAERRAERRHGARHRLVHVARLRRRQLSWGVGTCHY